MVTSVSLSSSAQVSFPSRSMASRTSYIVQLDCVEAEEEGGLVAESESESESRSFTDDVGEGMADAEDIGDSSTGLVSGEESGWGPINCKSKDCASSATGSGEPALSGSSTVSSPVDAWEGASFSTCLEGCSVEVPSPTDELPGTVLDSTSTGIWT